MCKTVTLELINACVILMCCKNSKRLPEGGVNKSQNTTELQWKLTSFQIVRIKCQ